MILIFTKTGAGLRQFMPFIEFFKHSNIKYECFALLRKDDDNDELSIKKIINTRIKINKKNQSEKVSILSGDLLLMLKLILKTYFLKNKIEYIYRARGIPPEESYLRNGSTIRAYFLSILEKIVLNKVDKILCVSENQLRHFENKYDIDKNKMNVIHNFLNKWQYLSSVNNLEDGMPELVYVGSYSHWQRIDDLYSVYQKLKVRNKQLRLLICSPKEHIEKFKKKFYNQCKEDVEIISLPYTQLIERISKSTVGIILRDTIAVNQVSSPFKVIDYLNAGLPVIMTDNIGDYPKILKDSPFICWIDSSLDNDDINRVSKSIHTFHKDVFLRSNIYSFLKESMDFSQEAKLYFELK